MPTNAKKLSRATTIQTSSGVFSPKMKRERSYARNYTLLKTWMATAFPFGFETPLLAQFNVMFVQNPVESSRHDL